MNQAWHTELRELVLAEARAAGFVAARAAQSDDGAPMLGGCYVAGTGPDERDQAFLAGVVRRAIEHQNQVRWTADAVAEDEAYRRYAWVG